MIERLSVQNFRCLESITLDFAGRPSALLIGKNGAGKSTVRHALSLFQSICRGRNRTGSLISQSDFSQHLSGRPMRFEVDLILYGKRFKYCLGFDWPDKLREARILEESLWVDGKAIFERQEAQIQLTADAAFRLDWHVFALPVIQELPGQQAIQTVKSFFASMVLIAPVPASMTSFSEEPSGELECDAANYASCLRALLGQKPAAYSAFDSYLKEVIPDFSSIEYVERGENGAQLMVTFEQEGLSQNLSIEFKDLSDGEKCFFLCAYILASTMFGQPMVCMWDEPDSHLSLSEVGLFITGLRKMAHKGCQFIATTHHPETVRKFSDETTIVLTRKGHLDPALSRPLAEFAYEGDLIHALMRDEIIGA